MNTAFQYNTNFLFPLSKRFWAQRHQRENEWGIFDNYSGIYHDLKLHSPQEVINYFSATITQSDGQG